MQHAACQQVLSAFSIATIVAQRFRAGTIADVSATDTYGDFKNYASRMLHTNTAHAACQGVLDSLDRQNCPGSRQCAFMHISCQHSHRLPAHQRLYIPMTSGGAWRFRPPTMRSRKSHANIAHIACQRTRDGTFQ
eukprot:1149008-Pelagomonas_calceolata.AAC.1